MRSNNKHRGFWLWDLIRQNYNLAEKKRTSNYCIILSVNRTWVPVLETWKPMHMQQTLPRAQVTRCNCFLHPLTGWVLSNPTNPMQEMAQARLRARKAEMNRMGTRKMPKMVICNFSARVKDRRTRKGSHVIVSSCDIFSTFLISAIIWPSSGFSFDVFFEGSCSSAFFWAPISISLTSPTISVSPCLSISEPMRGMSEASNWIAAAADAALFLLYQRSSCGKNHANVIWGWGVAERQHQLFAMHNVSPHLHPQLKSS